MQTVLYIYIKVTEILLIKTKLDTPGVYSENYKLLPNYNAQSNLTEIGKATFQSNKVRRKKALTKEIMLAVEYVLRGSIPYKKVNLYLELHLSFLNLKGKHLKILHENQKLIHPNLDNMKLGEGRERED